MEKLRPYRLMAACLVGLLVSTGYLVKVSGLRREVSGLEQSVEVLAAARPLELGERLAEGDIDSRRVPARLAPKRALQKRDEPVIAGQLLIHPVPAGDIVLWTDLADGPRGRRPTESIPEGLRSFSLPADEVHTQSHLLAPGDAVDILWTHIPEGASAPRTDVIAQRTRILAVGRSLTHEPGSGSTETPSSVTLLVTRELGILLATCLVSGEITFTGHGRGAGTEKAAEAFGGPPAGEGR